MATLDTRDYLHGGEAQTMLLRDEWAATSIPHEMGKDADEEDSN